MTAAATAVTVAVILPVLLASAMVVQIQQDLGGEVSYLGLAVAGYFLLAGLSSRRLGRLVDRKGWRTGMAWASVASATSLLGVALLAQSWGHVAVLLFIAGFSNAVGQPAANRLIFEGVPWVRHGLAFGIKQAAIPIAAFVAGLAVPAVALTVGWRWAFVGGSLLAMAVGIWTLRLPAGPGSHRESPGSTAPRDADKGDKGRQLALLAVSGGMGSLVAVSLATFYVSSVVAFGFSEAAAGLLLAMGSVTNFGMRLTAGWLADSRPTATRSLHIVAALLVAGAIGLMLLALQPSTWVVVAATLVAFGGGWGWPGVLNFAVIQTLPASPASATGVLQTGTLLGSALGPALFGFLLAAYSYSVTWAVMAAVALAAATISFTVVRG